ncbi:DUF3570 domain-containing protein [Sediminicola luteus]|uniref:DUF3570 domain-containing protein n=1 Tax=Sediminicola luteus TaxID=319238 RepID=A0A2A4G8N3_9FLAO|nr:DUF3570 domain-containing protein [Sediminicola luteus]PCE64334.1 hypothetical protein B7P33_08530 [Sediminicola luteus]
MEEKQEVAVGVIDKSVVWIFVCVVLLGSKSILAQDSLAYQKPVLDAAEVSLLFSYYDQDGTHAAVTGGAGTEELSDATATIVASIPVSVDGVLTVDAGISAYTSASSSNINPLDGDPNQPVSPWVASSGASRQDVLAYFNPSYTHSSADRNTILRAQASVSAEYDYFSFGFGFGATHWFNEKNTSLSADLQLYFDSWSPQYPIELRPGFFDDRIEGPGEYDPNFNPFTDENRNTYSFSLGLTQILGRRWNGALFLDVAFQQGLLSTPHQRVYFGDTPNYFIDEFQLADDVERLPDQRFKLPVGGRLNYFANDWLVFRSYYRFYWDDWGITAHTASLEIPLKLGNGFTVYPHYRYYTQSQADYFYPKEGALSSLDYYTSDYDLSDFDAHRYGFGLGYTDIFTKTRIFMFGFKNADFRLAKYDRSDGLDAYIASLALTFVAD